MDKKAKCILPEPRTKGGVTVEEAIAKRRSRRNFLRTSLSVHDLSQILWAAYGIIKSSVFINKSYKTAPSAGATYPLEIYAIIGSVIDLPAGIYKYHPLEHNITKLVEGDIRKALCRAAFDQEMIEKAAFCLVYAAVYERCTAHYGERGYTRYVGMDVGHSAQNVYLQAEALGLGTCAIGAFNDELVTTVLELPENEEPLYIMPIGIY
jgi:SagB-type dehydrogenase family enzyme